jgi:multidrug efflux pump subunit AcrA (membrane-fusion protein)
MTVTAPHDGIAYFGAALRGKWITAANVEKKLRPGGKLTAGEVVLTIVQRSPLLIRSAVPEASLAQLEIGQTAEAKPVSNPEAEVAASLSELSLVPLTGNVFDAVFSVDRKADTERIYPGMTCKLEIEIYANDKALTVPKQAVKEDGDKHHVVLANGRKRPVEVGRSNDKVTEILSGLKAGDVIKAN